MLFKQTQTNFILDDTKLKTLMNAYDILMELEDEMVNESFALVTSDDSTINYEDLSDILKILEMLIN